MFYLEVHDRCVEWEGGELGIYRKWSPAMPLEYAVSDLFKLAYLVNSMPREEALRGAEALRARAAEQLGHDYGFALPERFSNGIKNTHDLMGRLAAALHSR